MAAQTPLCMELLVFLLAHCPIIALFESQSITNYTFFA